MDQKQKYLNKIQAKIEESLDEFNSFQIKNEQKYQEEFQLNEGKWKQQENLKFAIFITANKEIFKSKVKRKSQKIFKCLSDYISTRNPTQCRSHFQKAIKKFYTIVKLRNFYRNLVGYAEFEAQLNKALPYVRMVGELRKKSHKSQKSVEVAEVEVQTDPIFMQPFFGQYFPFYMGNPEIIPDNFFCCIRNMQ